jgi:hypothetical protein
MTETEIEDALNRAWNGRRSDMRGAFHEATQLLPL